MQFFLDLIYLVAMAVAAPWLAWKSLRSGKYRAGWIEKLLGLVPPRAGHRPCVWFHAVSVGEVMLLRRVVAQLAARRPDLDICISTTTNTGMEVAQQHFPQLRLFYFPLDFSWAVDRAIARIRPDVVALAELELWPNFVAAAKRHAARVAVINGRMSPKSHRGYRKLRPLLRSVLRQIDSCLVQTPEYADRFADIGAEHIVVTGSVKYDGLETDRHHPATLRLRTLFGLDPHNIVWVAGSTSAPEETIVLDAYAKLLEAHPRLRLILVPRHKERFDEVAELIRVRRLPLLRRSALHDANATPAANGVPASASFSRSASAGPPVTLVDTLGELSAVWGLADVAFVGGSFAPRGGQNMIEPAAYGAAVLFGPGVWNFQDTVHHLLACGGAIQVDSPAALEREIGDLIAQRERRLTLGRAAQQFVLRQQGATERTLEYLERLLPPAAEPLPAAA